jgi:hypothetical protein
MSRNKSLGNLSGALLVIVMAVLLVAPGAWAQSKYKTLYSFTGGKRRRNPFSWRDLRPSREPLRHNLV